MSNETTPDETNKSEDESRRNFMMNVSLGLGGLAAAAVAVPVVAALMAPITEAKPEEWRNVGTPDDFPPGTTKLVKFENANPEAWAGRTAHTAAWVRRDIDGKFTVYSVNCTHLGCPVRWETDAELFMCPCHGGVYYKDGTVAAGPPPEPLPRYAARIENGQVQVSTAPIPITNFEA